MEGVTERMEEAEPMRLFLHGLGQGPESWDETTGLLGDRRAANWARIWWVRPVIRSHSTRDSPSLTARVL